MKTNQLLYSTRISSMKKHNNILTLSNLKMFHKPKIYHPLNPCHPFNLDMLNLNTISKRENALLINNKPLKDLILKYNLNGRKSSNENHDPNKYFFNKFKDEEKNYQLTIRAILKNDIDNFPLYLSGRKTNYKSKKINLKKNPSRNDSNLNSNNIRFYTSYSQIKLKNSKKPELLKERGISQYNTKKINSKNKVNNKYNLKSLDIKMKLFSKYRKLNLLKNIENSEGRTYIVKKNLSFSVTNLNSEKLGKISIFGVFEEIGIHGKIICSTLMNYLIDYFQKSKEMNVCIDKNNFYSILHWSFVNAQKYLILNSNKLKIDLSDSGCSLCFLLLPKDNSNKIYCANSGICKCLLYTNRGPDILSFSLTIDRPSERDRIYLFLRNKKYNELLKLKEEEDKKENENKKNKKENENKENKKENENENKEDKKENENKENKKENENKEHNEEIKIEENKINQNENEENNEEIDKDIKEEMGYKIKKKSSKKIEINEEELKDDYENSIRYFIGLGYTRSFGILSGEDFGLIPNPEINECDLKSSKVRYAILGNDTFWKAVAEPEIRFITNKYTSNKDNNAANKELLDLIRQKLGSNSKILDKIGFEVIYFENVF